MMNGDPTLERSPQPERVPTLTEVIDAHGFGEARRITEAPDWHPADPVSLAHPLVVDVVPVVGGGSVESDAVASDVAVDEQEVLVQALRATLARIDAVDDTRLRAALQPLIARFTDGLVAAVRTELASSLRELTAGQSAIPPAPPCDPHGAVVPSVSSR